MPTLEKTLREAKVDTGKHNGTTNDITDGYAHTGTGSDGDIIDYQIISTLPTITSNATALSTYTYVDTLSKGMEYNKKDVKIEWFKDAACTPENRIAAWTEADNKFTVTYGTAANNATTMTIEMTTSGLDEINNSNAVYDLNTSLYRGYSDCTMRITYTDFIFVNRFGETQNCGNLNKAIHRIIRDCNDAEFLKNENPAVLLPNFSCHSFRHTFTTRMCEAGVNIKVIQDALGHQDVSTTLNIYADVTRELKKKEFVGLDMYFMEKE